MTVEPYNNDNANVLLLDAGNSALKIAVCSRNRMIEKKYVFWQQILRSYRAGETTEEKLIDYIAGHLKKIPCSYQAIAVAAAVAPMISVFKRIFAGYTFFVLNSSVRLPVKSGYTDPAALGPDRLAAVLGAMDDESCAAAEDILVVSFGTAHTVTVLHRGTITGGAIAPGVAASLDALSRNTSALKTDCNGNGGDVLVRLGMPPDNLLACCPGEAVATGLLLGSAAWTDGLVQRYREAFNTEFRVVATGGMARNICRWTRQVDLIDEDLVHRGLYRAYMLTA